MFERFYYSFYQHPLLLWAVPVVFLFIIPSPRTFFTFYLWVFTLLSILDALLTGPGPLWLGLSPGVAEALAIFFVILGDFRFFLVIEHFSGTRTARARPATARPYATALAWSFAVPVTQLLLIRAAPGFFSESRHTFLAYEVLFFLLAVLLRSVLLPRRQMRNSTAIWLREICAYAMTYYALWAAADVMILTGDSIAPGLSDWGYGLRVLPNLLYYGLFLPFVFWRAPVEWRTPPTEGSPAGLST